MKDRPYPLVRRKHQTICLRSWRFCLRFRALKIRTKKTGNKAGRRISLDDPLLVLTAASLFLFVYSESNIQKLQLQITQVETRELTDKT